MNGLQAVNKDTEKVMLAYFFRKQEEQKVRGPSRVHFCNNLHAVQSCTLVCALLASSQHI